MNARLWSQIACLGAAVLALHPQPVSAYRRLADLPEFEGGAEVVWSTTPIDYSIQRDAAPGVSLTRALQVAEEALATWSGPECTANLSFFSYDAGSVHNAAPDDGRNTIEWLRVGWADRGFSADVMASADLLYERSPEGLWRIVEADIYLNAVDYAWSADAGEPDTNRRSIRAVLSHEAGHVIGLLHPCEPSGGEGAPICDPVASAGDSPVMHPVYLGPTHYTLAPDDEAGLCALYGCGAGGCGEGLGCVHGECRAACGSEVCGRNETCDGARCQPLCGGSICPPSQTCTSTAECAAGYECRTGFCIPALSQPGDPCGTDSDCATVAAQAG